MARIHFTAFLPLLTRIGCFIDGFFDAGMLLQALKAREATAEAATAEEVEQTKPSERAAVQARRRGDVGKKLRLAE